MRLPDLPRCTLSLLCSHHPALSGWPLAVPRVEPVLPAEWFVGPSRQSVVLARRASSVQAEVSLVCWSESRLPVPPLASCGDLVLGEQGGGGDSDGPQALPQTGQLCPKPPGHLAKQARHSSEPGQVGGGSVQMPAACVWAGG